MDYLAYFSDHTRNQLVALIARDGPNCSYCRRPFSRRCRPTRDHRIPKARGGTGVLDNLVAACQPCNVAKADQSEIEFRYALRGRRVMSPVTVTCPVGAVCPPVNETIVFIMLRWTPWRAAALEARTLQPA